MKHEEAPNISKVNIDIAYQSFATPDFRIRHVLIKCEFAMTQDMILKAVENFGSRLWKEYEQLKRTDFLELPDNEDLLPEVHIFISPRIDHKEVLFSVHMIEASSDGKLAQVTDAILFYYINAWVDMQKSETL